MDPKGTSVSIHHERGVHCLSGILQNWKGSFPVPVESARFVRKLRSEGASSKALASAVFLQLSQPATGDAAKAPSCHRSGAGVVSRLPLRETGTHGSFHEEVWRRLGSSRHRCTDCMVPSFGNLLSDRTPRNSRGLR